MSGDSFTWSHDHSCPSPLISLCFCFSFTFCISPYLRILCSPILLFSSFSSLIPPVTHSFHSLLVLLIHSLFFYSNILLILILNIFFFYYNFLPFSNIFYPNILSLFILLYSSSSFTILPLCLPHAPFYLQHPILFFSTLYTLHRCLDWERHVPQQGKGAAGSRQGQRASLPSLFCVFHLVPSLPHSCARHPGFGGSRGGGAGGPQTGRRWECIRRRRGKQRERNLEWSRGTSTPVAHLPERHGRSCSLHWDHDCRWEK